MNTLIIILTNNNEYINSVKDQLVSYFGGRMVSYYTQLVGLPVVTLNQPINDLDKQTIQELFSNNNNDVKFIIHELDDIREIVDNSIITI